MPHAKTDSEVTSLAPSSPPRSPPRAAGRPVYYVQSPSHDGEKTATSVHSTPALSPMASPRHSSSSSRFSGGKHKDKQPQPRKGKQGGWQEIGVIEEEGLAEEERTRIVPKRCYYLLIFVLSFFALFSFFALVLWGASRSQKPQVAMKSITFHSFIIQAGTDASLVPTDMATTNSTVKFTYKNKGTFFGIHVAADPFELLYSQLTLASGDLNKFYQSRSSHRTVSVSVAGNKVPLYGGGPTLTAPPAPATGGDGGKKGKKQAPPATPASVPPVPMLLRTTLHSRAYVLGALVKPRFTRTIECNLHLDPAKLTKPISLQKACQYS